MSTNEALPKVYDPTEVEPRWYRFWEERQLFRANANANGEPYCIVLPPPNVTGSLHLGHALTATIQDVLIRFRRMQGRNVLWVPGTDHAGIATQMVVERELQQKEGVSRHDLGREKFLERVWAWKREYGDRITVQHKALGASLDWSRERFTMDEQSSRAVREVFVRLYEEGLCHRANRLINWCPRCHTALSDLEVEHEENAQGELFSFAYRVLGESAEIVVATTRPETMLGDTAVAVHPDDPRYQRLIGRKLEHPFVPSREVVVVADDVLVDPEFGTGAVKVTPAHDFNDFECGVRHSLAMVNILTPDGKINAEGGPFAGQDRFEARRAVKAALEERGLARGTKPHLLALGRCQRCDTIVEPFLSKQWFVRADVLAKPAIEAVETGATRILPESWTKTYFHWMNNIRDWCVSRQLWWGHRIPAWYCDACEKTIVSRETPTTCTACGAANLRQDEDVLDTWFSSALWPFSTLGWPERTTDLARYYPNTVMETGFDILFFWVARMMMMGIHFNEGRPPFQTVFLHAMVRDEKGEKMSKTRGNVIDPLELSARYGADALRFTLGIMAAQGRDIKLSVDRIEGYRNFLNKIWNASRFAMMNLEGVTQSALPEADLELADRWILSRLAQTAALAQESLDTFRLNDAAGALYSFVWHELCDWYIELVKARLYPEAEPKTRAAAQQTLLAVLEAALRLLHPFIPFVTEEIWQKLPRASGADSIMMTRYPTADSLPRGADPEADAAMAFVMGVIVALRTIRTETGVPPGKEIPAIVITSDLGQRILLESHTGHVMRLARAGLTLVAAGERPGGAAAAVVQGAEIYVPLRGLIDVAAEHKRIEKEISKIARDRDSAEKRLSNPSFVDRAPADVVAKEREKIAELAEKLEKLEASRARLAEIAGPDA